MMMTNAAAGTTVTEKVAFTARSGEYVHLISKWFLLTGVTLGIARFWAIAAKRKYLWSHTVVNGSPFEFTGTGKELFKGFLIVLAFYFPVIFTLQLAIPFLGPVVGGIIVAIVAWAAIWLIFFLSYSARRYRLSRTLWQGVRFSMNGSAVSYAWQGFFWAHAVIFSLGLAFPWMLAALEERRMSETQWGDQKMSFDGTGRQAFKALVLPILIFVVIITALGFVAAALKSSFLHLLIILMIFVGTIYLMPHIQVALFKWHTAHSRLGNATATSDLGIGSVVGNNILFFLSLIGVGALLSVAGGSFVYGQVIKLDPTEQNLSSAAIGLVALGYFLFFASYMVLKEYFFDYRLARLKMQSLVLQNAAMLQSNAIPQASTNALGDSAASDFGFEIAT